jgi:hypothetical protein
MEENLELRMYFFTNYQLIGIQKGIQCGHAILEYIRMYGLTDEFKNFVENWKTWIILDGGTTNESRNFDGKVQGSLNQIADDLLANDIKFGYFQEPDLNDALTALCFICDERVFNKKDYPDFIDYVVAEYSLPPEESIRLRMTPQEELEKSKQYKEWVRFVGGVKNVFLRDLIKNKKLA